MTHFMPPQQSGFPSCPGYLVSPLQMSFFFAHSLPFFWTTTPPPASRRVRWSGRSADVGDCPRESAASVREVDAGCESCATSARVAVISDSRSRRRTRRVMMHSAPAKHSSLPMYCMSAAVMQPRVMQVAHACARETAKAADLMASIFPGVTWRERATTFAPQSCHTSYLPLLPFLVTRGNHCYC